MNDNFDIVVVGAGAAGVGAMRALSNSGLSTLLVEASARVGGRALTIAHKDVGNLDLGCGWLHSADRNSWVTIAKDVGAPIDCSDPAWDRQHKNLGFSVEEQEEARKTLRAWGSMMRKTPPQSDSAWDAALSIEGGALWLPYVSRVAGAITGKPLHEISVADYMAYRKAETKFDWRLPQGFGRLVETSLPKGTQVRIGTAVTMLGLERDGVSLHTAAGMLRARAVIVTVSTNVLASGDISLPPELAPWRSAAANLSLGSNEKLFLEILRPSAFDPETRVIGDPRSERSGAYYIRPLGTGVIEGFFGGEAADWIGSCSLADAFAFAIDQLANLFGEDMRHDVRPLTRSSWRRDQWIQGSYSCAPPGQSAARRQLAQSIDNRVFFAGEATHPTDFSTAHGAFDTGVRAAQEVIDMLAVLP